jgi:hypothetical protein
MQHDTPEPRRTRRKIRRRVKYESTPEYPLEAATTPKTGRYTQLLPQKRAILLLVLVLLFLAAFAVRMLYINEPSLDYHPIRQYHSAHIARGLYFEGLDSIPEWRKDVAIVNMEQELGFEPPIMEHLASVAYRITGGEHLWIPQLISAVFWLIGGVFLYLIARKIMSIDAAAVSTALYLFLPFTVPASSSFQPDPMMVMMFIVSIFTILRHHGNPSILRLLLAVTISGLAVLIKPVCIFPILGAFLALAVFRQGFKKSVVSPQVIIFFTVSILPIAFYYFGQFVTGLGGEQGSRFMPNLFQSWSYWGGWLALVGIVLLPIAILLMAFAFVLVIRKQMPRNLMILLISGYVVIFIAFVVTLQGGIVQTVIGFTAIAMALYGIHLFRDGSSKALIIGLWAGYFCFGLVFNYHVHTHDYYHLPLIPIVALSLGPIFGIVINRLNQGTTKIHWRATTWIVIVLVAVIVSLLGIGIPRANSIEIYRTQVRISEEIGEYVGHSTNTILLDPGNGLPLRYYGELFGYAWPRDIDIYQYEVQGRPELTVEERLNDFLEQSPDYFIVTDLVEFEKQEELKSMLTSRYPEAGNSDEYFIFDLRETVDLDEQFENQ